MLPANLVSGDAVRICPYDKAHVILAKSFNAHLIKCRQNHKGCEMVACPFDITHKVRKPELAHHISQCDKKSLMDRDLQMRAGGSGLKGDIYGPPIVSDHFGDAGYEEEEENWDAGPKRSIRTPALFNEKLRASQESSYGIIPGGGYVPPKPEEPAIRIIPNAPAKAATLSNPGAVRSKGPSTNTVFNYSLGISDGGVGVRMGLPRAGNSTSMRMSIPQPPGFGTGSAGRGMGAVRGPVCDSGPLFIGRGISKYATKSAPAQSATLTQKDSSYPSLKHSKPTSNQFEDVGNNTCNDYSGARLQNGGDTCKNTNKENKNNCSVEMQAVQNSLSNEEINLKKQQLALEKEILLNYQQQIIKLKEQHANQLKEMEQKHELQKLQLQKLQLGEKQRLIQEQDRADKDLVAKTEADRLSLMTTASSICPGILGPMAMERPAVSSLQQQVSSLQLQDSVSGLDSGKNTETWHEEQDGSSNPAQWSETDTYKTRRKLEKKLKQIEALELKMSLGHRLSKEEETKLKMKTYIRTQLDALPVTETKESSKH